MTKQHTRRAEHCPSLEFACFKLNHKHGATIVMSRHFATYLTGQTRHDLQTKARVPLKLEAVWQARTAVANLKTNQSTHLGQHRRHMPIV